MPREGSGLCPECMQVNLKRIIYCALVAIPISLTQIIIFSLHPTGSDVEAGWRIGIILSHATMLFLMLCFALTAWRLQRVERLLPAKVLLFAVVVTLLGLGVVITAADQLVTSSITPYALVCMGVGALFLIPPLYSAALLAASFAAFYFAIAPGLSPAVLLSNRTNGMATMAIGFGLSVAMWRHFMVDLRQRRQIEAQSKELERINLELQNMAFTDSLTGLPNRRYFDQAVARELSTIRRSGLAAGLIEFDLDFFKEINDSFGHAAGDAVLRQIAALVGKTIRQSDMFARYGGEEFILLLPRTNLEGARIAAEKLRAHIEAHVFSADGQEIRLTASFGVAELNTDPAISCYRAVDQTLYRAKQRGRNRVEVMAPNDPEGSRQRMSAVKAP